MNFQNIIQSTLSFTHLSLISLLEYLMLMELDTCLLEFEFELINHLMKIYLQLTKEMSNILQSKPYVTSMKNI